MPYEKIDRFRSLFKVAAERRVAMHAQLSTSQYHAINLRKAKGQGLFDSQHHHTKLKNSQRTIYPPRPTMHDTEGKEDKYKSLSTLNLSEIADNHISSMDFDRMLYDFFSVSGCFFPR